MAMADFDLDNFVKTPSVEQLNKCRKDDLLCIAAHFKIAVTKQQLKRDIKSIIVQRLVELGVLVLPAGADEDSLSSDVHSNVSGDEEQGGTAEVEGSETKAVLPPFEPFSPISVGSGGDAQLKVCLARVQMEAQEWAESRRAEMKLREVKLEVRRLEIESEKQVKLRELELNAAKISPAPVVPPVQAAGAPSGAGLAVTTFEVSKHISLVPQFREAEVDSYFGVFERIASALNWSREVWPLLLQCKLTGKAQEVCATLSLEDSLNYDIMKAAILRAYELVPEAYRQRFRGDKKNSCQTFVEFAREKGVLFDKWCVSSKVTDFKTLRELILLEEFKNCIPERVIVYLNEQKVTSLSQASVLADEFALTHKNVFTTVCSDKPTSVPLINQSRPKAGAPKSKEDRECFYCHKSGHLIADCSVLKRKQQGSVTKSVGFVKAVDVANVERDGRPDSSYEPFLTEGFISITGKSTEQVRIKMLRDTGTTHSFVVAGVLPFSEQTFCGSNVLVQGIEIGLLKVPLHQVHLQSELCTGFVKVGVCECLPVKGVQFILGNDLAGGKVFPVLEVFDNPVLDQADEVSEMYPEIFPACAVTRAQARKKDVFDLSSSFIAPILADDVLPPVVGKTVEESSPISSRCLKLHVTR
ncbi:uncharacterized protein [Chanodichthys erythropterus]|uniref:uncharacterized protein n=1 Tax=Chanodichthys erythropterus TaxID=933992 RepID=UPI00351DDD50